MVSNWYAILGFDDGISAHILQIKTFGNCLLKIGGKYNFCDRIWGFYSTNKSPGGSDESHQSIHCSGVMDEGLHNQNLMEWVPSWL